jgi:hypothetical protein
VRSHMENSADLRRNLRPPARSGSDGHSELAQNSHWVQIRPLRVAHGKDVAACCRQGDCKRRHP